MDNDDKIVGLAGHLTSKFQSSQLLLLLLLIAVLAAGTTPLVFVIRAENASATAFYVALAAFGLALLACTLVGTVYALRLRAPFVAHEDPFVAAWTWARSSELLQRYVQSLHAIHQMMLPLPANNHTADRLSAFVDHAGSVRIELLIEAIVWQLENLDSDKTMAMFLRLLEDKRAEWPAKDCVERVVHQLDKMSDRGSTRSDEVVAAARSLRKKVEKHLPGAREAS